jgi:prophage regulatory protein
MGERILRFKALSLKVSLGRTSIYQFIADGAFPAPIKLGARATGWRESEIDAWIASREKTLTIGQGVSR